MTDNFNAAQRHGAEEQKAHQIHLPNKKVHDFKEASGYPKEEPQEIIEEKEGEPVKGMSSLFRPQNHLQLNERQLERIRRILEENVSAINSMHAFCIYHTVTIHRPYMFSDSICFLWLGFADWKPHAEAGRVDINHRYESRDWVAEACFHVVQGRYRVGKSPLITIIEFFWHHVLIMQVFAAFGELVSVEIERKEKSSENGATITDEYAIVIFKDILNAFFA